MSGITAVSWGQGRIDVFWVADDAVWHRAWTDDKWTGDERLGGEPASSPAAVSWAANEMQLFVVGRDGHLWNIYWDSQAWHHWVDLGGSFALECSVAASTWGPDRIDIFVSSNGQLWHRWWNGSEWVPWQNEGEAA